jgi:rubrerythrin
LRTSLPAFGSAKGDQGRNDSHLQGGKMEKYSIAEVIEQAVQTERLGYQFYTTMAERFKEDIGLRKLFETLGSKELVHEKRFSERRK